MILSADNEYTVVLDACVLVGMPVCDTLLRFAEHPALYRPVWSDQILDEVGRALVTKLKRTEAQRDRRLRVMRDHFPEALVHIPAPLAQGLTCNPDPDDRHVLAAAIQAGAEAICTNNVKDFPPDCLAQFEVVCQTPDDFLVHQFHLSEDLVMQKIASRRLR